MEELQKACLIALGSTFKFYLKAHIYHWNVENPDFLEYHELFGNIYEEVYGAVDPFAEKIRAIQAKIPQDFQDLSMLSATKNDLTKDEMVKDLYVDNESMNIILKAAYDRCEEQGEHGFSNFLAERLDAHRKHGWMLRASMKA